MWQPRRSHTPKYNIVSLQRLQMYTGRQRRVHALRQPFAYLYPPGDHRELGVTRQNFVQFAEGSYEVGPFRRVLEVFQGFVDGSHVHSVLGVLHQFVLFHGYCGHCCWCLFDGAGGVDNRESDTWHFLLTFNWFLGTKDNNTLIRSTHPLLRARRE